MKHSAEMAESTRPGIFYTQAGENELFCENLLQKAVKGRVPAVTTNFSCSETLSSNATDALVRIDASADVFPAHSFPRAWHGRAGACTTNYGVLPALAAS